MASCMSDKAARRSKLRIKPIPNRQAIVSSFLGDDNRQSKFSYSHQICITSGFTRNVVIPNHLEIGTDQPGVINGDWLGAKIDTSLTRRDI
jgi:hypothetical protein